MSPLFERFDLRRIAPQPWKNGAGLTREIAAGPEGADAAEFEWRISVAEVGGDGPFSAFPGIDRSIVLLDGAGMLLTSNDGSLVHRLDRRHEPFCFSGDLPLEATLLDGPTTDFNVMTRRGTWEAEVLRIDSALELPAGDAGLLFCIEGDWRVDGPVPPALFLGSQEGLLWRQGLPALALLPLPSGTDPRLLSVRLRR
jgi:environmental stress-induced protein Ves